VHQAKSKFVLKDNRVVLKLKKAEPGVEWSDLTDTLDKKKALRERRIASGDLKGASTQELLADMYQNATDEERRGLIEVRVPQPSFLQLLAVDVVCSAPLTKTVLLLRPPTKDVTSARVPFERWCRATAATSRSAPISKPGSTESTCDTKATLYLRLMISGHRSREVCVCVAEK